MWRSVAERDEEGRGEGGGSWYAAGGDGSDERKPCRSFLFYRYSLALSLELVKYQIISLALGWCYYKLDSQLLDSASECS